jgi:hypothetical protein
MCELSTDGIGPVANHCHECDRLIHVASLPQRIPGRGFAIAIDPHELKAYMCFGDQLINDIAA